MQPDLLDTKIIQAAMPPGVEVEVLPIIASTNDYLLAQAKDPAALASKKVCLTENQYQGRGQHGRTWLSPQGQSLAMSVLCPFTLHRGAVNGLSLVVGIAIAEGLTALGYTDVQLKWPNDIVHQGHKLGGVLVETVVQQQQLRAVIGIGLNVHHAPSMEEVGRPVTCLAALAPPPTRTVLAITLLQHLFQHVTRFHQDGFPAFLSQWHRYDALYGKPVTWQQHAKQHHGIAAGVSTEGALQIDTPSGLQTVRIGEVSVLPQEG